MVINHTTVAMTLHEVCKTEGTRLGLLMMSTKVRRDDDCGLAGTSIAKLTANDLPRSPLIVTMQSLRSSLKILPTPLVRLTVTNRNYIAPFGSRFRHVIAANMSKSELAARAQIDVDCDAPLTVIPDYYERRA